MAKPRRTPPLFEVIKEPLRRVQHGGTSGSAAGGAAARPGTGATGGPASPPPPAPIPIARGAEQGPDRGTFASPAPPNRGTADPAQSWGGRAAEAAERVRTDESAAAGGGAGGDEISRRMVVSWPAALIAIAATLGVIVLVWGAAYRLGAASERNRLGEFDGTSPVEPNGGNGDGAAARDPMKPDGGGAGGTPRQETRQRNEPRPPAPVAAGTLGMDPRLPGNNYLIIAQLNAKDAEAALAWLNAGGVRATAFPKKRIDPTNADAGQLLAAAKAKNELFWVIDAEGIPSAEYRDLSKRADNPINSKINKVIELGRRWKREAKGASNFDTAYYERYTGK